MMILAFPERYNDGQKRMPSYDSCQANDFKQEIILLGIDGQKNLDVRLIYIYICIGHECRKYQYLIDYYRAFG